MKFNSFSELGKYMGIKAKEQQKNDVKKCSTCGGEMTRVPGTNIFVCGGVDGKPCKRFALSK